MNKINATISLDPYLKAESSKLFAKLGFDFSTAISIFLRQAIQEQGLPFEVKLYEPNSKTIKAFKEIKTFEKGKKTKGKLFNTPEESFKELGI